jgi:hypothetical protein
MPLVTAARDCLNPGGELAILLDAGTSGWPRRFVRGGARVGELFYGFGT